MRNNILNNEEKKEKSREKLRKKLIMSKKLTDSVRQKLSKDEFTVYDWILSERYYENSTTQRLKVAVFNDVFGTNWSKEKLIDIVKKLFCVAVDVRSVWEGTQFFHILSSFVVGLSGDCTVALDDELYECERYRSMLESIEGESIEGDNEDDS